MLYPEVKKKQEEIITSIVEGRLLEAFDQIKEFIQATDHNAFQHELDVQLTTYENILKYAFEYPNDPEREKIYTRLCRSLFELTDKIGYTIIRVQKLSKVFALEDTMRSRLAEANVNLDEYVEHIANEREFSSALTDLSDETPGIHDNTHDIIEDQLRTLFYYFMYKPHLTENDVRVIQKVITQPNWNWIDKSQVISALFLSSLITFDAQKLNLLFAFYQHQQDKVWQRSLVCFFLLLLVYDKRIGFYPDITNRIKSVPDQKLFSKQLMRLLLQFLKARDTERITKRIREEIIPEVMKMRSDIEDKLKLNDLLNKDNFEEKNPDWKDFFGDTPDVYQKFEEFSMMQLEGNDVFMSAFSMLKNFPFFNELSNWFQPFDRNSQHVRKSAQSVGDLSKSKAFLDGLEGSSMLCNSDKYSFCFNIQYMPEMQKNMMINLFNMEIQAMNEMENEEKKHLVQNQEIVFYTQYLQDIYRFMKLHTFKTDLPDVFALPMDFKQGETLRMLFGATGQLRSIAEYYFSKDLYNEALNVFELLAFKDQGFEVIEKVGFCYQKTGDYQKAIETYKRAEILDTNQLWLLKKLGFCYRKVGDFEKAIEYYKRVNYQEPNNLDNLLYLGHLHIDAHAYQEALNYYFEVEYQKPESIKVQRPIGWCCFLLGKLDKASQYFSKVLQSSIADKNDYLNMGHIIWATGKAHEAVPYYQKAYNLSGNDSKWLRRVLKNDVKHLHKYPITERDVFILIDLVVQLSK